MTLVNLKILTNILFILLIVRLNCKEGCFRSMAQSFHSIDNGPG